MLDGLLKQKFVCLENFLNFLFLTCLVLEEAPSLESVVLDSWVMFAIDVHVLRATLVVNPLEWCLIIEKTKLISFGMA